MRIRMFALAALLFMTLTASAQEKPLLQLYTGEIDGKIPVTLFLEGVLDPCNGEYKYRGIYTYQKDLHREKWLLLAVDYNDKGQYIMVETGVSGVLILQHTASGFSGTWISPDGKTLRKVSLRKQGVPAAKEEFYLDALEHTHYRYNDC
ncbi:hypothetical protein WJU16_09500 [Chitinophaga pollutisoli]|uniref:NlpE N-terminal domain-containing protein n=1 Tax=Chitinophaga pollutisoli TaxID=3133966 RepID=A0ABZ2YVH9_9BACT